VGTIVVVVADVLTEESEEVTLTEHEDVIEQVSPERADPALREAILPRGLGRRK
jgi:hypothetical protein